MYIYANGCSMTYGSELHDDPVAKVCTNDTYRYTYAWPGRLRGLLSATGVYNDAVPSGSNDRVLRTSMTFVARWLGSGLPADDLLVVVGWSHPARREFHTAGEFQQVVPHHGYRIPALNRLVRAYRRYGSSEEEARWRYLTQVGGLASFLRGQRVRYLFFNAITSPEVPAEVAGTPLHAMLTDQGFLGAGDPTQTMVHVLRAAADSWHVQHPNETGHRRWAERLNAELRDRGITGAETRPRPDLEALHAAGLPIIGGARVSRRLDRKRGERLSALRRPGRWAERLRTSPATASDPFIYP